MRAKAWGGLMLGCVLLMLATRFSHFNISGIAGLLLILFGYLSWIYAAIHWKKSL